MTTKDFIEKARKKHLNLSKFKYENNKARVP